MESLLDSLTDDHSPSGVPQVSARSLLALCGVGRELRLNWPYALNWSAPSTAASARNRLLEQRSRGVRLAAPRLASFVLSYNTATQEQVAKDALLAALGLYASDPELATYLGTLGVKGQSELERLTLQFGSFLYIDSMVDFRNICVAALRSTQRFVVVPGIGEGDHHHYDVRSVF